MTLRRSPTQEFKKDVFRWNEHVQKAFEQPKKVMEATGVIIIQHYHSFCFGDKCHGSRIKYSFNIEIDTYYLFKLDVLGEE